MAKKSISGKIKFVIVLFMINLVVSGLVMAAKYSDNIAANIITESVASDEYLWNNEDYSEKETTERIINSLIFENEKSQYTKGTISEDNSISAANNPMEQQTVDIITHGNKNVKDMMTIISVLLILIIVVILLIIDTVKKYREKITYRY